MRTIEDSLLKIKSSSGFTLVELLVVIAILSVLLALSTLNYQSIIGNFRVNGASRQFLSDLGMVKISAIKNNRPWAMEVAGSVYCIKNQGPDGNWQDGCTTGGAVDDQIIKTVDIGRGFPGVKATYEPVSSPFRVIFKSDAASDATYTITICNSSSGSKVLVNQYSGSIKIIKDSPCP